MKRCVALELPASLAVRLHEAAAASGQPVEEVILAALDAKFLPEPGEDASPQERLNWLLRDIAAPPLSDEDDALLAGMFGDESDLPELSAEEVCAAYPPLDPPLSQTLIEDREDRV